MTKPLLIALVVLLAGCKLEKPAPEPIVKSMVAELTIIDIRRNCTFSVMDIKNKLLFRGVDVMPFVQSKDMDICQTLRGTKFQATVDFYESGKVSLHKQDAEVAILQIILEKHNAPSKDRDRECGTAVTAPTR